MNKFFNFLRDNIEIVFISLLVLAVVAVFAFSQGKSCVSFMNTGQIGDTIGGITAPFLNLIGIILLYLTLREQTLNTNIQRDSEAIAKLFSQLKTDFENTKILVDGTWHTGTNAIFEMTNILTTCDSITECMSEVSVKSFNLHFIFLTSTLAQLLKRNHESKTNIEDKIEIFNTANQIKKPLIMFCEASTIYYKRRLDKVGGGNINELEKQVFAIGNIRNRIVNEVEKYKIQ